MDAEKKLDIVQGIIRQGLRGAGTETLLVDFGERLMAAGVSLMRANLSQTTLHPTIAGYDYEWWIDEGEATISDWQRGRALTEADYAKFPFVYMYQNQLPTLRVKVHETNEPSPFPLINRLRERGGTDYFAIETKFEAAHDSGAFTGFRTSWATGQPGGFKDTDIDTISALLPSLGLAIKATSTYRVAKSLMETYLGADAGNRVLNGEIVRGSVDTIRAVVFSADLQGFTRISEELEGEDLIGLLSAYFECIVDCLEAQGGEVLKFMGDGILAIFRLEDGEDGCKAALDAAENALKAVRELSTAREAEGKTATRAYMGLHKGDVLYGNIGSADRLDFTVVGPAVNETARIEAMCRSVERDLVISSAFRDGAKGDSRDRLVSLGRYALRGISRPQELFTLDSGL